MRRSSAEVVAHQPALAHAIEYAPLLNGWRRGRRFVQK
jgi:hypothetical protein